MSDAPERIVAVQPDGRKVEYVRADKFDFVMRVFRATAFDHCEDIWWRTDDEYAPLSIFVTCNDLFWWATADSELVTPDNIDVLEQAYRDSEDHGGLLFCCRVRRMRPQGPYYKYFDENEKQLFDACGPEREVGIGNPSPPMERMED